MTKIYVDLIDMPCWGVAPAEATTHAISEPKEVKAASRQRQGDRREDEETKRDGAPERSARLSSPTSTKFRTSDMALIGDRECCHENGAEQPLSTLPFARSDFDLHHSLTRCRVVQ